ncbi:MAG: heme exporter protein CcmD [Pseudomonadota bacterium]
MMRESLDHWPYVIGAYALTGIALGLLIVWSWRSMRKAEQRRDEVKRR